MTPVLLQLTYISTASPSLLMSDVEQILQTSRRRNALANVTGLLIFDGKRFLQALEGSFEAVEATFARIALDPRHRAMVKLSNRHVETREFGAWSMASHLVGPVTGSGSLADHVDAMTDSLTDPNVRKNLRGFARIRGGG